MKKYNWLIWYSNWVSLNNYICNELYLLKEKKTLFLVKK